MTDQLRISDSGEIEVQPLTEDGEPIYSPSTLRELFSSEAFKQLRGQTSMDAVKEQDAPCSTCGGELRRGGLPCKECGKVAAIGRTLYLQDES